MQTEQLTQEQKETRIQELYKEKTALLEKYGVFGGGVAVNEMHQKINAELESLGVDENS